MNFSYNQVEFQISTYDTLEHCELDWIKCVLCVDMCFVLYQVYTKLNWII